MKTAALVGSLFGFLGMAGAMATADQQTAVVASELPAAVLAVFNRAPSAYADLTEPTGDPLEERRDKLRAALAEEDSPAIRLALATVYRDMGKAKKGMKILEPLLTNDAIPPTEIQALRNDLLLVRIETSGVFGKVGAADDFKDACKSDLEKDPANGPALLCLVRYYDKAPGIVGGSKDKARSYLDHLKKSDTHRYWMARAELLDDTDDPARAAAYAKAIAAEARPQSLLFAAKWSIKRDRFDDAFRYLDTVLAKEPENRVALFQFGRAAAHSGRRAAQGEDALLVFLSGSTLIRAEDYRARAHAYLGLLYERQNQRDSARQAYRAALTKDDDIDWAAKRESALRQAE